jgi:preprotein translocase subunit YajC
MKKLMLVVFMLTLQVTFSQSRKSKEKAFKQVVSLIKKGENFNGGNNIKIISHDFDDLTITVKINVPFSGGAKRLVHLKLKDLKDLNKNTSRTLSTTKIYVSVVMTFKNDFKIETIKNEETSLKYAGSAFVTFEEDSKYIDKFIKALDVLM